MTVRDMIRRSLVLIGVLADGETPSSEMLSDGFLSLKDLLGSWSNENLIINAKTKEEFNLVGGQQTYTMGQSGNFNTLRAQKIENAIIQTLSNPKQELPVEIITQDRWAAIPTKETESTFPTMIFQENSYPLDRLNLWPIPSAAIKLILWSWKPLSELSNVNTVIELPPGYDRAIRYNLALELCPEYGKEASPTVATIAVEAKENIKRMNIKPIEMVVDNAILGIGPKSFNILTGE